MKLKKLTALLAVAAMAATLVVPIGTAFADDTVVDVTVSLGDAANYTASGQTGVTNLNLIELAQQADPQVADDIVNSGVISVTYEFVAGATNAEGNIDLRLNEGGSSFNSGTDDSRFLATRIYKGWNQLDTKSGAHDGFNDSTNKDIDGKLDLNISGKFDKAENINTTHTITATIDYDTLTIRQVATGTSTSDFTFTDFPSNAQKGNLYLSLYPSATAENNTWTLGNIKITYQKTVDSDVEVGDGTEAYVFDATAANFSGGSTRSDGVTDYVFQDGIDTKIKDLLKDEQDETKVSSAFSANYINYIGKDNNPTLNFSAKAGKYKLYYIGVDSEGQIKATINNQTLETSYSDYTNDVPLLAVSTSLNQSNGNKRNMRLYDLGEFSIPYDTSNQAIAFNHDDNTKWLPDLYGVLVIGTAYLGESTEPDESPEPDEPDKPAPTIGTIDDLVAISENYTFIADDFYAELSEAGILANGDSGDVQANTLNADKTVYFQSTTYKQDTGRGTSNINGREVYNSLTVKANSRYFVIKLEKEADITFYWNSGSQHIRLGNGKYDYEISGAITGAPKSPYTFKNVQPGTIYVLGYNNDTNNGGDLRIAGFEVKIKGDEPDVPDVTFNVLAEYASEDGETGALNFVAKPTYTADENAKKYGFWFVNVDGDTPTVGNTVGGENGIASGTSFYYTQGDIDVSNVNSVGFWAIPWVQFNDGSSEDDTVRGQAFKYGGKLVSTEGEVDSENTVENK